MKKTKKKSYKKEVNKSKKKLKALKKTIPKIKNIKIKSKNLLSQIKNTKKINDNIKVKTYIRGFDKLIQGGFEKNSTNLVIGGAGCGKTIFATNFLLGGMKNGEKCLFVTFEEKKEIFYNNMLKLGINLEEYEKKGLFYFLEYTPIKVKTMLEEGGGTIESLIIRNKISRMVIDSITSFALLFENELEKKEASLNLFNMISSWDCTSVLTLEEDEEKENPNSPSLEFETDSIIIFYFPKKGITRKRYLEILKMRGVNHSKKTHRFYIDKKGMSVSDYVNKKSKK